MRVEQLLAPCKHTLRTYILRGVPSSFYLTQIQIARKNSRIHLSVDKRCWNALASTLFSVFVSNALTFIALRDRRGPDRVPA